MKRLLFAVFAHPDDESIGPCATLCKEVVSGAELHLVCVTDGSQGAGAGSVKQRRQTRLAEWHNAGAVIGAAGLHPLGYGDGELSNSLYHEVAGKIEQLIRSICLQSETCEVKLLTFAPNGLTGHLDHIAVSYITTYVFYKLKQTPPAGAKIKELAYFCLSDNQAPKPSMDYFVFMPAGYNGKYINRRVDAREVLPTKYQAMRAHRSQATDVETALDLGDDYHAVENFHVIT